MPNQKWFLTCQTQKTVTIENNYSQVGGIFNF